jgi:beta-galactosidase
MVHIAVFDDTLKTAVPSRWSAHWYGPKMISSWTLPHCENQIVRLATFTNCDSVELFLNGESMGEKELKDFPNRIMTWYVPYAPGTLEAVGKRNGEACASHRLQTAGEAGRIVLLPDRTGIRANGTDIVHVEVNIADDNGVLVPSAEVEVRFEADGAGKIIGVDNGNLASDEPYKGSRRTTWLGKCLAIVQSNGAPGRIALRVSAEGLAAAETVILASET